MSDSDSTSQEKDHDKSTDESNVSSSKGSQSNTSESEEEKSVSSSRTSNTESSSVNDSNSSSKSNSNSNKTSSTSKTSSGDIEIIENKDIIEQKAESAQMNTVKVEDTAKQISAIPETSKINNETTDTLLATNDPINSTQESSKNNAADVKNNEANSMKIGINKSKTKRVSFELDTQIKQLKESYSSDSEKDEEPPIKDKHSKYGKTNTKKDADEVEVESESSEENQKPQKRKKEKKASKETLSDEAEPRLGSKIPQRLSIPVPPKHKKLSDSEDFIEREMKKHRKSKPDIIRIADKQQLTPQPHRVPVPRRLNSKISINKTGSLEVRNMRSRSVLITQSPIRTESCKVDRYGWIVEENQQKEVTKKEQKISKMEDGKERQREEKWRRMINKWNKYQTKKSSKLHRRVKKGIPDSMRAKVWQLILDPDSRNKPIRTSLEELVAKGRSSCCDTIEKDLLRTMPQVAMFSDQNIINSLRTVLHAYSNVDPEVGYFQGMAFIAAVLILYMSEVDAFWCFKNLMNGKRYKLRFFYLDEFKGLNQVYAIWDSLLQHKYPKIGQRLKQLNILPMHYSPSWFLCAFMNIGFPPVLKLRMFDRFITFGTRALLSFGLVVISRHKELLLNGAFTDIITVLQFPSNSPQMEDWRYVIKKWDKLWISQSEYKQLFDRAKIPIFF